MQIYRMRAAILVIAGAAALPSCSFIDRNLGTHTSSAPASSAPASSTSSSSAPAATMMPASQTAVSPDLIKQVQTNLQQGGLYKGQTDGVYGPETKAAVRSYQQQHNLSGDGQLDSATLASMNLGTGASAMPASSSSTSQPGATGATSNPAMSAPPPPTSPSPTATTPASPAPSTNP